MNRISKVRLILCLLLAGITFGASARNHLLYTPQLMEQARKNIKTDSNYRRAWEAIRSEAQSGAKRADFNKMESMALAYLMTDSTEYADGIIKALKKLDGVKTWGSAEMLERRPQWRADLGLAHKTYIAAIGYDAVRDRLSAADHAQIVKNLNRLSLQPSLEDWILDSTRIHSLNSMGHNWWTSCAGMGGIMALVLRDDLPEARKGATAVREALPQWFGFAGDRIQNKMKTFDDKVGGMYESFGYSCFGISEALQFLTAWRNSGLPDPETSEELEKTMDRQLRLLPGFFCQASYPRTGYMYSMNFGDGHKNCAGQLPMMFLWNLGVKDDNILWYMSHLEDNQHRDVMGINSPIGFLYMPYMNGKKTPDVDLPDECLWDTFGWATMRDSWDKDATMLAVKSGHTWNHAHADANSFILYHKGEDIIRDGGNCNYGQTPYREYFFQSPAHNIVTFNGEAQPRLQQYQGSMVDGRLSGMMSLGDTRYVMGDATGPTGKNFARNHRHFLWLDNILLVIDDLESYQKGTYEWIWHPNGKVVKKGGDLVVTNNQSEAVIRPLYPQPLVPSGFVHDYPEHLYMKEYEVPTEDLKGTDQYYGFCLPEQESRVKGVTAIILKDSVGQEAPRIERREGSGWIGLRMERGDSITDVYINQLADGRLMHLNSWINPDGWETDAYMLAITYPANAKPTSENSDMFLCYGSALRRDSASWFASQSKLNVMTTSGTVNPSIRISGQPHGIAYFGMKKPRGLDLPIKHTTSYSDGRLKIVF